MIAKPPSGDKHKNGLAGNRGPRYTGGMRSFLLIMAAALLWTTPLRADDEEGGEEQPAANEITAPKADMKPQNGPRGANDRPAGITRPGSGGGGGGSGSGGGSGGGSSAQGAGAKKKCLVYESLKAMPHGANGANQVAHGVLSFTGDGQCIAVGFDIKAAGDVGRCESGESPLSPTDDACQFTYSIGKTPGSAPLNGGCKVGPINSRGGNLNFTGADPKAKLPGRGCALPPGRYYCTISATGFSHPEQPARHCGGLLASPMLQNRSD